MQVTPFLKWAGGKRRILKHIRPLVPAEIDTYYEPFLGGGAVFFALAAERRFRRARISDVNQELVTTYRSIQRAPLDVLRCVRSLPYSEVDYYTIRSLRPTDEIEIAARMLYLNRCGFNGLYRHNSSGEFNAAFGKAPTNPTDRLITEELLVRASEALHGVEIACCGFADAVGEAAAGDFVYLDPPYVPITARSHTEYHSSGFGDGKQRELARVMWALRERGVSFVASNSDTETTREIYAGLDFTTISAPRTISATTSSRGSAREVLIQ